MKIQIQIRFLLISCLLAASLALPTRGGGRWNGGITSGDAGATGEATGDETFVESESTVIADGDTGKARSKGRGGGRGRGRSGSDLGTWGGLNGYEAEAGGKVASVGEDTESESDAETIVCADQCGRIRGSARSRNRGRARGRGGGAVDTETSGGTDSIFGEAGGGGKATGELGEIESESEVDVTDGGTSQAKARGRGAATNSQGLASVNLEEFAGIDQSEVKGSVLAIGQDTEGNSEVGVLVGPDGSSLAAGESSGKARGAGRVGTRTNIGAATGNHSANAAGESKGEGDHVETFSNSKAAATDYDGKGQSSSGTSAQGRGSSFAESSASVNVDG